MSLNLNEIIDSNKSYIPEQERTEEDNFYTRCYDTKKELNKKLGKIQMPEDEFDKIFAEVIEQLTTTEMPTYKAAQTDESQRKRILEIARTFLSKATYPKLYDKTITNNGITPFQPQGSII